MTRPAKVCKYCSAELLDVRAIVCGNHKAKHAQEKIRQGRVARAKLEPRVSREEMVVALKRAGLWY